LARIRQFGIRQKHAQLVVAKAKLAEVDVGVPEIGQLACQRFVFPLGQLGQLVISQEIGALLDFAEVIEDDYRCRF